MHVSDFRRLMPKQYNEDWILLAKEFDFLFQSALIDTVEKGFREVGIIFFHENNYEEVAEKLNKKNLFFTPLDKSFCSDNILRDYSQEQTAFEPRYWKGCVTRDYKTAEIFKSNFKKEKHKILGRMLGYPDCCTSYFEKNYKKNSDPIWSGKKRDVFGYPECNNLLHYFGIKIVPHFTCSPDCEKSKSMGGVWFDLMKELKQKEAKKLYEILSTEMTWDSYHGVVQVETPYFLGVSSTFPFLRKKIINWNLKE